MRQEHCMKHEKRLLVDKKKLDVTVSPLPARDSPHDYTPTTDIPLVESANTPEDPWWDWQAEEDPHVQERVWAAIEALEESAKNGMPEPLPGALGIGPEEWPSRDPGM
ncbi:hypothetical protein EDB85DRAFT_1889733 [Lactarius pseudohatsudake]|nr:hypothetical protein EDB85DRAFT_1889733 [Lactarius pseudohatsudake]